MIKLNQTYINNMIVHAKDTTPNECCGIIASKNGILKKLYKITNSAQSPFRYIMYTKEFYNAYKEIDEHSSNYRYVKALNLWENWIKENPNDIEGLLESYETIKVFGDIQLNEDYDSKKIND